MHKTLNELLRAAQLIAKPPVEDVLTFRHCCSQQLDVEG